MDTAVWAHARQACSDNNEVVIGWYHSHPNLGAFFSGTDRYTQRHFFQHEHCLGLVVDPIRHDEKWFVGPDLVEYPLEHVIVVRGAVGHRLGNIAIAPDSAASYPEPE